MNIKKKIESEARANAPDLADKIAESVDWEQIAQSNAAQKQPRKSKPLVWGVVSAVAAAVICLAVLLPVYLSGGGEPQLAAYAVTIEVNPRVRLEVNSADVVTKQYGLNEDGVLLLYKENYVGQNVDDATRAVMRKLDSHGFLKSNSVKLCVYGKDGSRYADKQNSLAATVEKCLAALGEGKLELMDEDEFERIEKEFKDKDLGEYEKSLIQEYKAAVIEAAREKDNAMKSLIAAIAPFADKDGKTHIPDLPCGEELAAFAQKYGYEFDFEPDRVRGKDLYELSKDLKDEIEDLDEAIKEIEKGKDEDDYKDLLEDLYEIVEDYLFEND